jgi:TonB family protein
MLAAALIRPTLDVSQNIFSFFGDTHVKKFILPIATFVLLVGTLYAGTGRKVVKMNQPTYPALAKQMHISGTVKLEATVEKNGQVKDVKVLGGHPLLSDAAASAAKNWKYEPAGEETVETISVNFNPGN